MSEGSVLTRIDEGVGIISLNRPERHNAINDAMSPRLHEALQWAMNEKAVRCIVLRGEGKSFCSGRDTTELGQRKGDDSHFYFVRRTQDGRLSNMDSPKPFIAAVRGYALGGGFEMALSADMRVAGRDAIFALPEINYGIVPDTGGTQVLTSLIGPAKAKFVAMTGERIDAATAFEWGIVDWLVAPDEVDAKALEIAKKIAAKSPIAVAMTKQLVDNLWGERIRSGIRQELLAQVALYGTEDYQEARAALRDKRAPVFKGK